LLFRIPKKGIKMTSYKDIYRIKINGAALALYRNGVSVQETQEIIDGDAARVVIEADVSLSVISIVPLAIAGEEAIR